MSVSNKKKNTVPKTKANVKNKPVEKKSVAHRSVRKVRTPPPAVVESPQTAIPVIDVTLKVFLTARCCSAIWGIVTDCDETYNYWEPVHFLLYGKGFQTWEYNPPYALRSYLYLLLFAGPAYIYAHVFNPNRVSVFYFIRCIFGFLCALAEAFFFKAVNKAFGGVVAGLAGVFLAFSPGMFIASTAFLPSSFSMYACLFATGAWLDGNRELAMYISLLSMFLGWPFSILTAVPLVFDMLILKKEYSKFAKWSFYSICANLLPAIKIDSDFYGRFVAAPFNIIFYNVFSNNGSSLYGTEPASFYFINGFLNFNLAFVFALLAPPIIVARNFYCKLSNKMDQVFTSWRFIAPLYIWLAVFTLQPHKEERFLFPVYPFICLSGALAVYSLDIVITEMKERVQGILAFWCELLAKTQLITLLVFSLTAIMGMARITALHIGYKAPLDIYMEFYKLSHNSLVLQTVDVNVCVGKEWHRFPTNFFLPCDNWNLKFLKSEFRGQLPAEYVPVEKSSAISHPYFNDMNKEEESRYIDIEDCHFLVDFDNGVYTALEPNFSNQTDKWKNMVASDFLNKERSHPFFRAFFFPFISGKYTTYSDYNMYISTKFLEQYGELALSIKFRE